MERKDPSGLRILMISLDPGLAIPHARTGNVIQRHLAYADRVAHLDIVVFGGEKKETRQVSDNLTLHITGEAGWKNIFIGRSVARSILRGNRADVIVAQDPHGAGWVAMKLKQEFSIPLVIGFHGDFWNNRYWEKESFKNRIYSRSQKKVVEAADGIRVVSGGIKEKLLETGIDAEKVRIISTPINDELYTSDPAKLEVLVEELRYKYDSKPVLLFVGRFYKSRNLIFLLQVVEELKKRSYDFRLVLIGAGETQAELRSFIANHSLDEYVRILPSMVQEDLLAYYALAQSLVLLSTNESFGKVIIEAGLFGTPTIASETTGAKHIIEDGTTGLLVPINDFKGTVEILEVALENPEDMKVLGENARAVYRERFSSEQATQQVIAFWQDIART